eukprot:CAMPEP_0117751444 /NCGR_PEP_ID=MMETSP0947-20121206/10975_1 /TAXON_ID=44440 /ORGANISM="Chattonella subsalsa, Strain CCMP2191" /LENGTH=615 /DNA_ID=CAMNT_0005569819 /DNA_START=374 /DNA_END=2221 /DNA_ORIENTATION=-
MTSRKCKVLKKGSQNEIGSGPGESSREIALSGVVNPPISPVTVSYATKLQAAAQGPGLGAGVAVKAESADGGVVGSHLGLSCLEIKSENKLVAGELEQLQAHALSGEATTTDEDCSEVESTPASLRSSARSSRQCSSEALSLLATASQGCQLLPVTPLPITPHFSPSAATGLAGQQASQLLGTFVTMTEGVWPTSRRENYQPALSSILNQNQPHFSNLAPSLAREKASAEHSSLLSAIAMGAIFQGYQQGGIISFCANQSRSLLSASSMMYTATPERARALMHLALLCYMQGDLGSFDLYIPTVEHITSVLDGPADIKAMLKFCKDSRPMQCADYPMHLFTRTVTSEEPYRPDELAQFNLPVQFYLFSEDNLIRGRILFKHDKEKLADLYIRTYETVIMVEKLLLTDRPGSSVGLYIIKLGKFFIEMVCGSHVAALSTAYLILQMLENSAGLQFCPSKLGHVKHMIAMLFQRVAEESAYNRLKKVLCDNIPDYGSYTPDFCDAFVCKTYCTQFGKVEFDTDPNAGVVGGKVNFQKEFVTPYNELEAEVSGAEGEGETGEPAMCAEQPVEEAQYLKVTAPSPSSITNIMQTGKWPNTDKIIALKSENIEQMEPMSL